MGEDSEQAVYHLDAAGGDCDCRRREKENSGISKKPVWDIRVIPCIGFFCYNKNKAYRTELVGFYADEVRKYGSIINVGVTPLRCHFQHYFLQKNKHTRLTYFTIKVTNSQRKDVSLYAYY